MSDGQILAIYHDMKKERVFDIMFEPGAHPTAWSWLEYVRGNCWLVRMTESCGEPFGVMWLDNFMGSVATFHYFVYRRMWGKVRDYHVKEIFDWLKENIGQSVCNIIGCTPKDNRLAVRMLKRAGFDIKFEMEDINGKTQIISHRRL
jgi:hypothetical protein